jgi:exodeoxyribonuclease-5
MTPDWSPQQQAALAAVSDWFQAGNDPIMRVFGYAGTGKTTLARHFASQISGRTEYAAFTGKAFAFFAGKAVFCAAPWRCSKICD